MEAAECPEEWAAWVACLVEWAACLVVVAGDVRPATTTRPLLGRMWGACVPVVGKYTICTCHAVCVCSCVCVCGRARARLTARAMGCGASNSRRETEGD